MAIIKPFKGIRPQALIEQVASRLQRTEFSKRPAKRLKGTRNSCITSSNRRWINGTDEHDEAVVKKQQVCQVPKKQ